MRRFLAAARGSEGSVDLDVHTLRASGMSELHIYSPDRGTIAMTFQFQERRAAEEALRRMREKTG